MPISYTKRGWTNNSPPAINAANLGAMDDALKLTADKVDTIAEGADVTATALASAIEGGTPTTTPDDTDKLPGVKSDHSRLYYTWANIKTALGSVFASLTHASSHQHGGADEIATATPAANAIPKADGSGKLDSWISDASASAKGKVQLAQTGVEDATKVPKATGAELAALLDAGGYNLDGLDDGTTYKRVTAAQIAKLEGIEPLADVTDETNVLAALEPLGRLPTVAGKVAADDVGAASGANTGEKLISKITNAGYSLDAVADGTSYKRVQAAKADAINAGTYSEDDIADGTSYKRVQAAEADKINDGTYSEDDIADGTSYKRVTAAEKSALTAGYVHLQQLADAEAAIALWDYKTAAKMPPALLREIVEAASNGAATVKYDDLGFPSMMYVIRGPILAGHIHSDMGGITLGTDDFPAFRVNGVQKTEIFISMFKMTSFNGTNYQDRKSVV